MIELNEVSRSYGAKKTALPPTTAAFGERELVWLRGPSGSGKSTLLGIASLLITSSTGSVRIDDRVVPADDEQVRSALRREFFGIVPQAPTLFPELTAAQNVMLAAEGVSDPDAHRSLARVGLERVGTQPVKTLSGGEQQRVSIARALSKRPRVIFADELTSALDDANAHRVWKILRGAVDEGCAVVVASHDSRITEYADRTITLGGN